MAIWACAEASSEESGSSSTIAVGSAASARAIAMRWRCPPLNSCGKRSRASAGSPTCSSSSARARRARRSAAPAHHQPVGDLTAHPPARVQRRVRVLEDHLQARVLRGRARGASAARAAGLRTRPRRRGRHEPDGRASERRLAAAALADQADDLAAADGEARVHHGPDGVALCRVVDDLQVADGVGRASFGEGVDVAGRGRDRRPRRAARTAARQARLLPRSAQRGWKAHPRGRRAGAAARRRDRPQRRPAGSSGWAARRAARACTDAAAAAGRPRGARLDDAAGVEDRELVGDRRHHAEVVRDQHDGERAVSRRRRSSRRRIPACTVTSSAVVGSSAISSVGSHASAEAIAIRWRIPPENWCG